MDVESSLGSKLGDVYKLMALELPTSGIYLLCQGDHKVQRWPGHPPPNNDGGILQVQLFDDSSPSSLHWLSFPSLSNAFTMEICHAYQEAPKKTYECFYTSHFAKDIRHLHNRMYLDASTELVSPPQFWALSSSQPTGNHYTKPAAFSSCVSYTLTCLLIIAPKHQKLFCLF